MKLREHLEVLRLNGYAQSVFRVPLSTLVQLAGIKVPNRAKSTMVSLLYTFLKDKKQIENLWNGLSSYEQDCVRDYIWNGGYLIEHYMEERAAYYGLKDKELSYTSKAALFFQDGYVADEVMAVLGQCIGSPKMAFAYGEPSSEEEEAYYLYETSDKLYEDVVGLVKLAGTGKIKVTKAGAVPTKAATKRINETLHNKEYESEYLGIGYATKGSDTMRIYGLCSNMFEAKVLDSEGTDLIMGTKATAFLKKPFAEQMKMLVDAYKNNKHYNEVERIRGEKFEVYDDRGLSNVRQVIIEAVGQAPVNEWVDAEQMANQYYEKWRPFLIEAVKRVMIKNTGYSWHGYFNGDWESLERPYIDVVFLEGLVPLGIVDVWAEEVCVESSNTYQEMDRLRVKYFRLTPLGAYLLGQTDVYEDPSLEGRVANALSVDDDLCIWVGESVKKYEHQIFFEQFMKGEERDEAMCYQLNFAAALTAFNSGISLSEVLAYLKKQCTEPLPVHVEPVIKKWEMDQQKVHIRTVTVVTCEDRDVLEELLDTPSLIKCGVKPLPYAIEIERGTMNKVKKEIEKQHYFCNVENNI